MNTTPGILEPGDKNAQERQDQFIFDLPFILGHAARLSYTNHGKDSWVTIGRDVALALARALKQQGYYIAPIDEANKP